MGLFPKLVNRKLVNGNPMNRAAREQSSRHEEDACCNHGALAPHWNDAREIGHEQRASSYLCENCGEAFTPIEAYALHVRAINRLRRLDEPPSPN